MLYLLDMEIMNYRLSQRLDSTGIPTGNLIWQRLDGSQFIFDDAGTLIYIDDEKGNRLALSYIGPSKLDTVTDLATNRSLKFYYNSAGRLEQKTRGTFMILCFSTDI